jgi:hypothetical protein
VSNVSSVGFRFLCRRELEDSEAKDFSAKNIMLNTQVIFREVVLQIQGNLVLRNRINVEELQNCLIIEIDSLLSTILVNLADSYPQAPASGGTPRMREVISDIDRVDDEQNDFIFTSGIQLADFLKLTNPDTPNEKILFDEIEDHTEFIMHVLNAAIEITQDNKQDAR